MAYRKSLFKSRYKIRKKNKYPIKGRKRRNMFRGRRSKLRFKR